MGIFLNGNQSDYQAVGTPAVYTYTASGTIASTTYPSTFTNVVAGLNLGIPISGTNPASGIATFLIPANFNNSCKEFIVVGNQAAGALVYVSGTSPNTINSASGVISIAVNTSKHFFNDAGNNWITF